MLRFGGAAERQGWLSCRGDAPRAAVLGPATGAPVQSADANQAGGFRRHWKQLQQMQCRKCRGALVPKDSCGREESSMHGRPRVRRSALHGSPRRVYPRLAPDWQSAALLHRLLFPSASWCPAPSGSSSSPPLLLSFDGCPRAQHSATFLPRVLLSRAPLS